MLDQCMVYDLMRSGGYPFGPDELSLDEWFVLGLIATEREAMWRRNGFG